MAACDPDYRGRDMEIEAKEFDFKLIQAGHVGEGVALEDGRTGTYCDVEPGREVTFALNNAGTTLHTWVILKQGHSVTSASELTDEDVLLSVEAEPGKRVEAVFPPLLRGEYQVICAIPGHLEAGMRGTLIAGAEE